MDRGNGDDGRCDLDLQAAGIELAEEGYVCIGIVEAADEILIARDHHHHDQAGHQRRVDEAQHGEDHLGFAKRKDVFGHFQELVGEGHSIDGERRDKAEIEHDQQPAARKDDPLDKGFERLHGANFSGFKHRQIGAIALSSQGAPSRLRNVAKFCICYLDSKCHLIIRPKCNLSKRIK